MDSLTTPVETDVLIHNGEVVTDDDLAQDTQYVQELIELMDSHGEEISEATNAVTELTRIADGLEASRGESEVFTPREAALVELALEGVFIRANCPRPLDLALESEFSSNVSAKIDKIRETAKKFIAALLERFREATAMLIRSYNEFTNVAGRQERYAQQLLNEVKQLKGAPQNSTYKNAMHASRLFAVDHAGNSSLNIVPAVQELVELVNSADQAVRSGYVDDLNRAIDAFVQGKDAEKFIDDFVLAFNKSMSGHFVEADPDIKRMINVAENDLEVMTTDVLPGGYVGVAVVPGTTERMAGFRFTFVRTDADLVGDEMPVANLPDLKSLLEMSIEMSQTIQAFNADKRRLEGIQTRLTAGVRRISSASEDLPEGARKDARALALAAPMVVQGVHTRAFAHAISTNRVLLQYCEACVRQYKQVKVATEAIDTSVLLEAAQRAPEVLGQSEVVAPLEHVPVVAAGVSQVEPLHSPEELVELEEDVSQAEKDEQKLRDYGKLLDGLEERRNPDLFNAVAIGMESIDERYDFDRCEKLSSQSLLLKADTVKSMLELGRQQIAASKAA